MESRNLHRTAGLVLVLFMAFSMPAMAANIYRYVDNLGRMVWDSKIPPEYVKNGYTILNERGQVVQVVPRALTPEEIAEQSLALESQKQAEEDARKQLESDNLLLRLFRSPEDIERKRDEKLDQLEVQRTVLTSALNKTGQEVTRLSAIVDRSEAAGTDTAADVLASLKFQNAEKERLQTLLANLEVEKQQAISDAERDIARLLDLMGLPK